MSGRKILHNMFGLDWRSLALMRIGLAAVTLADVIYCICHAQTLFTDDGAVPRSAVTAFTPPFFSLHMLGGSLAFELALFALEVICALMMLVGYRTRLATVACWFLLISRQGRNPIILFGADMILRIMLFWAMFLPLNRRYSLDVAWGRVSRPKEPDYLGLAGFGAIIQFLLIYLLSGMLKDGAAWRVDHTAVYYSLAIEMYSRPLGTWLNQFDNVTTALTVLTLYLELYGPILFILPIGTRWGRLLGFVIFSGLQLSFGITMQMGLFWIVMIAANFFLLPAEFWTWFAEPVGRWLRARLRPLQSAQAWIERQQRLELNFAPLPGTLRSYACRGLYQVRAAFLLFITFLVIYVNFSPFLGTPYQIPNRLYQINEDLGLHQYFNLFAPYPQFDDGWVIVRGVKQSGGDVDLLTGVSPVSIDKPANVADTYGDEKWASLLLDLCLDDYANYRIGFVTYMGKQWNDSHSPSEQLINIELIYMHQMNGPNHTKSDPEALILCTQRIN